MALIAREWTVETEDGVTQELVVACPQRITPASIHECASCELCGGLDLGSYVGVRCTVAPANESEGSPAASSSVAAIMTTPVVWVEAHASLENVRWLMLEGHLGAVPVVNEARRPIGIVTKTDLLRERDEIALSARPRPLPPDAEVGSSDGEAGDLCAIDVMTPVVHTIAEHTSIAAAAAVLARERLHHVIVLRGSGEIAGMVSALDIVQWVAARARFVPRVACAKS